jgi:hypothetical protein
MGSPLLPSWGTAALMSLGSPPVPRINNGQLQLQNSATGSPAADDDAGGAINIKPALSIGREGTYGISKSGAPSNSLNVIIAGERVAYFNANQAISVDHAQGGALMNEASSTANPTLVPNKNDPNTGIGNDGTNDELALVAGGRAGLVFVERSNQIIQRHQTIGNKSAAGSPQVQGNNEILGTYNVFTTVNVGDVASLPNALDPYSPGTLIYVKNAGRNTLTLYPDTNDTILRTGSALDDFPGQNAPISVKPGETAGLLSQANNTWHEFLIPSLKGLRDVNITGSGGSPVDTGSPLTPVQGDILYYDGTNWVNLPRGTAGQVLTMGSPLLPSWQTPVGGSPATHAERYLAVKTITAGAGSPLTYRLILTDEEDKYLTQGSPAPITRIEVPGNNLAAFPIGSTVTITQPVTTTVVPAGSPIPILRFFGGGSPEDVFTAGLITFQKWKTHTWDVM